MKYYTCVTQGYDTPTDPEVHSVRPPRFLKPLVLASRLPKILSHFYFQEMCCWVDGNITVIDKPAFEHFCISQSADIVVWKHPFRNTLAEEFDPAATRVPIQYQRGLRELQKGEGAENGDLPLYEANVVWRRSASYRMIRFNEVWWSYLCRYTWRDQLSLPLALKSVQIRVATMTGDVRNHPWFFYKNHNKDVV